MAILKELRDTTASHLTYTIFDENKQYSIRDLSKSDTFFLWLKLLTSVLRKVHHPHQTMNEMLDKCREYYQENQVELTKLEEFRRTYKKEDAIRWYTTPTFVSKLINKALKTEDFRALYLCRAYITDLSDQLRTEFEAYKALLLEYNQPLQQWTVYHGRTMSVDEIEILRKKVGHLISLNGFLSTSRQEQVAKSYSHEALFEIETTFALSHGCFAHVAPMSQFPQEDEVLFDLASVFKLLAVKYDSASSKWRIYLQSTDEGTNVIQAYIDAAKAEADETNVDFIFARLLIQMGEYELADDYLTKLGSAFPSNEQSRDYALVHYYIGLKFYREGRYAEAMKEYEKALEIQRILFPDGHSDTSETLGGIGLIYDNTGKYDLALDYHLESLSVCEKILPSDHVHTAESLNNIGLCYDRLGKFELALEFDIRALEMKQRLFPYDHPDIATSLNNIGLAYYNHYDFEQALNYHQQALAMKERCLPSDHPELATSYCNLGLAHLALNHVDEAVMYYMRDLEMSERTLPPDHAEIGITHHNIGQAYRTKEKGSTSALQHYQKAIDIYMRSLPREHPFIGLSLLCMSEVYCDQNNMTKSLECGEEACNTLKATLPEDHRRRAEASYTLAKIHHKLGNTGKALGLAQEACNAQLKTLTKDHEDVQKTLTLIQILESSTGRQSEEPALV
ncbi:unnamed protein product [Rotaria magnacalcarata]|nr:unnamed protein product [Rotaria magnacalcarata]